MNLISPDYFTVRAEIVPDSHVMVELIPKLRKISSSALSWIFQESGRKIAQISLLVSEAWKVSSQEFLHKLTNTLSMTSMTLL